MLDDLQLQGENLRKQVFRLERTTQLLNSRCEALELSLAAERQKSQSLEAKCNSQEERLRTMENTVEQSSSALELSLAAEKQMSQSLEAKCNNQEERLRTMEGIVEQLWTISRDEITLGIKKLYTGSWGYVKKATFRGRRVAAKCLYDAIRSPHNQELFAKEIKIFVQCHHKNLVEFIGVVPDIPAIILIEVMDCTLQSLLANRKITTNQFHPICIDVAEGLIYLHSIQPRPVIHHDVSASNVLLKSVGIGWIAKLSDLCSARFVNKARSLAPEWASAPEVQQGDASFNQTEKVDVYSYGVLLIEVLTRQMPTGILSQLIDSLIPLWPQFISLIQHCTDTDPAKRPTMREVITSLNKITTVTI